MAFFFEYLWICRIEKSQMKGSDNGLKKRKPIIFKRFKQQHNRMGVWALVNGEWRIDF
jgi:hypothetical protein